MLNPLLDSLDVTGHAITADSLHTPRTRASYLHGRGAHIPFQSEVDQPKLFDALDALPWHRTRIGRTATARGHGKDDSKVHTRSGPARWPPCATSASTPTNSPAAPTSPKPPAVPTATDADPSRSSD